MNLLQNSLSVLGSIAPCALLLWLAASVYTQARADSAFSSRALHGMALGLAAAGLWWPLQLASTGHSGAMALAGQLALLTLSISLPALAACAATSSESWQSGRRVGTAAAALLLSALGIAAVSSAAGSTTALLRSAIGAVALAGALFMLAWPAAIEARTLLRLRVAAALAAAAAVVFAPVPLRDAPSAWAHPALWPTLGLALFGVGLLALLRQRLPVARVSPRLPAQPPEPLEDALTRLPTRTHFENQLAAAVVRCDASHGKLALLFIDLDGFKPVNDTFGHSSGDRVLQSVGKRLKACAESGDVIARVGGDEFLVLINDAGTQEEVSQRARKIVDAITQPFEVEDRQVGIGCSIGIAFYPDNGQHAKLIARADAAMYAAKRAGGAGFCFFVPAMEDDARERFDLLRDLRMALESDQLELYYQPKMDAATGKVTAAEALLRWQHPTRGMVPPSVFIPIAERFGLIRSIGQWVIDDACRQARVWLDKGLRMRVAINLSAVQMRQEDIVARIEGALARHRVDPSLLTCEITESVAMEDTKATQATFRELGAAGIHLSIDDFGTGYSSLSYLRKLPAEELKIDRSFVMDVEYSADARAVIDAVVKLAHALGLKVVAEGVENERQQEIMVQLGCDELQGFLFAKPMTARALLLWAMDDRQHEVQSFATSLFASTRGQLTDFEPTRGNTRAFADTAKIPLTPLPDRGAPQVH
ncbi:MAG: EAL domain-containing protein [Pseudomonadota bacterium]